MLPFTGLVESYNLYAIKPSLPKRARKQMLTLVVIIITSIIYACSGTQWAKEGVNQSQMRRDLNSCVAIAKIQGRTEFPEFLVYPSMEFGAHISIRDINHENFVRAKITYESNCMFSMEYRMD
jgi:hypothetical protein